MNFSLLKNVCLVQKQRTRCLRYMVVVLGHLPVLSAKEIKRRSIRALTLIPVRKIEDAGGGTPDFK